MQIHDTDMATVDIVDVDVDVNSGYNGCMDIIHNNQS